jgi:hypothetical protein
MPSPNGLNPTFGGTVTSAQQTPAAAGGTLMMSFGNAGFGIYAGSGVPTISAVKGSLYLRTDGSTTATRLYINNGTTTWVAVTTAS